MLDVTTQAYKQATARQLHPLTPTMFYHIRRYIFNTFEFNFTMHNGRLRRRHQLCIGLSTYA